MHTFAKDIHIVGYNTYTSSDALPKLISISKMEKGNTRRSTGKGTSTRKRNVSSKESKRATEKKQGPVTRRRTSGTEGYEEKGREKRSYNKRDNSNNYSEQKNSSSRRPGRKDDGFKEDRYSSEEKKYRSKDNNDRSPGYNRVRERASDIKDYEEKGREKRSYNKRDNSNNYSEQKNSSSRRPSRKDDGFKEDRYPSKEKRYRSRDNDDRNSGYNNAGEENSKPSRRKRFGEDGKGDYRPSKMNFEKSYGKSYLDEDREDTQFERKDDRKRSYRKDDSLDTRERKSRYSGSDNGSRGSRYDNADNSYSERKEPRRPYKKDYFDDERPVKRSSRTRSKPYDEFEGEMPKDQSVRLNKYISNAGICSRREADVLIASGAVSVNGKIVTEMGFKVQPGDIVNYGGERLISERKKYLLLNKPKGFITTTDDPQERKTVMGLISNACKERIYPVGRLDRSTTGLLFFTNDGEMAKKLTHPSHGAEKIYHVELDKPLTKKDMQQILDGMELEDGIIKADDIQYVGNGEDKKIVGIQLHSGKNRIVRRIFESLGYEIYKLDRVTFAGLTKKDLPRGKWRFLTDKEIAFLKML